MSDFMNKVYRNNAIIYKVLLFLLTTVAIVYLFPKGGQFKYEFSNGQVWQYDNLYAPFDFAIHWFRRWMHQSTQAFHGQTNGNQGQGSHAKEGSQTFHSFQTKGMMGRLG